MSVSHAYVNHDKAQWFHCGLLGDSIRATNAHVSESGIGHALRRIKVAPVDDHREFESPLEAIEIKRCELFPVGQD